MSKVDLKSAFRLCPVHLRLGYEFYSPHSDSHGLSLGYELSSPHSDLHGLSLGYELCSPQWLVGVTGHLSMNCPRLSDAYCSHYYITLTKVWMAFASVRFTCTYSRRARNCAHLTVTHMAMVLVYGTPIATKFKASKYWWNSIIRDRLFE